MKNYRRIISFILSLMMVFSTIPSQVFALDDADEPQIIVNCGLEEHTHTEDCYEEGELVCLKTEHTHSDLCYAIKELTCTETVHVHTDDCKKPGELTCTKEEHKHGPGCEYDPDAGTICGKPKHQHGPECQDENGQLVCTIEPHNHAPECYPDHQMPEEGGACTKEEHEHDASCYGPDEIICGQNEHTHDEHCYQYRILVCTKQEHTHEESCYDEDGNTSVLDREHTHKEFCYAIKTLTCNEDHEHTEDCYTTVYPPTCTCDERCIDGRLDPNCPVCAKYPEDCDGIIKKSVEIDIRWMDNGNNDQLRPSGEDYMKVLTVLVYDKDGNVIGEVELPDNAKYTEGGNNGGHVEARLPMYDEDGNELFYKIKQDDYKLRQDLNYISTSTPGEMIINQLATTFTVTVELKDGANSENGLHTDYIRDFMKYTAIVNLMNNGVPIEYIYYDENNWVFDPETGVGTYVFKYLPKYDENGTENNYTLNLYTTLETICGREGLYINYETGKYLVEYDNADVPNHGADTEFIANTGTLILTLRDRQEYRSTKYWLDADKTLRPTVKFELWRYTDTKDGTKNYRTASPVRDTNNTIISVTVDGTNEGTSTDLWIAGDQEEALVKLSADLPKYDAEGYEYIYFLREVNEVDRGATYEQVFDPEVELDEDGNIIGLIEHNREDDKDKSVYNSGIIVNRIKDYVTPTQDKRWDAKAYMDDLEDIEVEMTLYRRCADENEDWEVATDLDGNDVIVRITHFSSVNPTQTASEKVDKYDELGHVYEYKWVETAVYENGVNVLNDDGTFVLEENKANSWDPDRTDTLGGVSYTRQNIEYFESSVDEDGVIVNRLVGKVDYLLQKEWYDADGNPTQPAEGTSVTFVITNDQGLDPIFVTLNGSEENAWAAQIKDLPKYTADGTLINYKVREAQIGTGYSVWVNDDNENRIVKVVNSAGGNGMYIPVAKLWKDDADSGCRYASVVNVYYLDPETDESTLVGTVTLSTKNGWYDVIRVPDDFLADAQDNDPKYNYSNYYIKEAYLLKDDGTQYMVEDDVRVQDDYSSATVTSDRHMYLVDYKIVDGVRTVINRRYGFVSISATKTWVDKGIKYEDRPEASLVLSVTSDNAELIKVDGAISGRAYVYVEGVSSFGVQATIPLYNDIPSGQIFLYTFDSLPKYDSEGKTITYAVAEVWKNEANAKELDYITTSESVYTDNVIKARPINDQFNYSDCEVDDLSYTYVNRRYAETTAVFYKEWNDQYVYQNGKRPDIYLKLYATTALDDYGDVIVGSTLAPYDMGYKLNTWTTDSRNGRNNAQRYWQITFKDLQRYTDEGAVITYYAQECANLDVTEFDYTDTKYRDDTLSLLDTETETTWVVNNESGEAVLRENGTFVNEIKSYAKVEGKKVWQNIPEGYIGRLPEIEVTLYRYLATDATKTETLEVVSVEDPENEGHYIPVVLGPIKTDETTRSITFSFYHTDGVPASENHYDVALDRYNEDGILYVYTFYEHVLQATNRSDEIDLGDLFINETDGNLVLTNVYPGDNYKGTITVGKAWTNRPTYTQETLDQCQFPKETYTVYQVYISEEGVMTETKVAEETISARQWYEDENTKVTFDGKEFPIFAPDGFKYVYYVTETDTTGYKENVIQVSGNLTHLTGGETAAKQLLEEKGAFTFNTPDEEVKDQAVTGEGNITNEYDPKYGSLYGTKTWNDYSNAFGTRIDFEDVEKLGLKLYRYAESQPGENNGIGTAKNPLLVEATPVWTQTSADKWTFRYNDLEIYAPNGVKWTYIVKENPTADNDLNGNYNQNRSWTAKQLDESAAVNVGNQTNHLSGRIELIKQWVDPSYLDRPECVFELQVNINGQGWTHARDTEPFASYTKTAIKDGNDLWNYRLKPSSVSNPASKAYSVTFSNYPTKLKIDGEWVNVSYRFIEIQVGDYVYFESHEDGSCLIDDLRYREVTTPGEYQPTFNGLSLKTSGEYKCYSSKTTNKFVNGLVELEVRKIWDDTDDIFGVRPESVTFNIQRAIEGTTDYEYVYNNDGSLLTATIDETNNWTKKVTGLLEYNRYSKKYVYRAVETDVEHYVLVSSVDTKEDALFVTTATNRLNAGKLSGTKVWDDLDNYFGTRPTIDNASVLGLELYRYAPASSKGNDAIGSKSNPNKVDATPTWEVSADDPNKWVFTYPALDVLAPNGEKWVYIVKENITDANYKDNYRINRVWSEKTLIAYETVDAGSMTNTLGTKVALKKEWDDPSVLNRPAVEFELQVKIGDGSWQHANDVDIFKNMPNIPITDGTTNWNYKFEAQSDASNAVYEKTFGMLPARINVNGTLETVDYRFVETKVGDVVIFDTHSINTCLAQPLVYPDTDIAGEYQPSTVSIAPVVEGEYKIIKTTIKNTFIYGNVSVEVKKIWDDADNASNYRPESITFKVQRKTNLNDTFVDVKTADGTTLTITITEADNWTKKIDNLPLYERYEVIYTYRAVEIDVDYYINDGSDYSEDGTVFTTVTTNRLNAADLSGIKSWDDQSDMFKTRPSIDDAALLGLTLYRYAEGDDEHEPIGSALYPNKVEATPTWKVSEDDPDKWIFTYDHLEIYAPTGVKWTYFVKEDMADAVKCNYKENRTWDAKVLIPGVVVELGEQTNHIGVNLELTKIWDDNNENRPSATFELQVKLGDGSWQHARDTEPFKSVTDAPITDGTTAWNYVIGPDEDETTVKFEKLPSAVKTDNGFVAVEYRFVEIKVGDLDIYDNETDCLADEVSYPESKPGDYQPSYGDPSEETEGEYVTYGFATTNEFIYGKLSLEIKKLWEDSNNHYGTRPDSITVKIVRRVVGEEEYSDILDADENPLTVVISEENGWSAKVNNLPMYKSYTEEYEYKVVEFDVDNHQQDDYVIERDGDILVTTITNKLNTVVLSGTKYWETPYLSITDVEDGIVELILKRKTELMDDYEVVDYPYNDGQPDWELTSENVLTFEYVDLPECDNDGNPYTYIAQEVTMTGFVAVYETDEAGNEIIRNYPTALMLDKVDKKTKEQLSSELLELTLYDMSGNIIAIWTRLEDEDGIFTLNEDIYLSEGYENVALSDDATILYGLPLGKYKVSETGVPEGYRKAKDAKITLTKDHIGEGLLLHTVEDKPGSPGTGDNNLILLWSLVLTSSGMMSYSLYSKKRKEKNK